MFNSFVIFLFCNAWYKKHHGNAVKNVRSAMMKDLKVYNLKHQFQVTEYYGFRRRDSYLVIMIFFFFIFENIFFCYLYTHIKI